MSGPAHGLRWGLIGASDIAATSLIPAIRAQTGSEVAAVYSRSKARGEEYARRWGIPRSHDNLQDLLHDSVDAVYVSTTNERHCAETIAAAAAGRHVLCEKPLALTLDDAVDMVRACRRAGVVLATNHGRRNDAALRMARDVVRSGRLGRLLSARTSNSIELPERLRRWRLSDSAAGAGAVLDMVVHEADTLRFVLDEEPTEVTALTGWHGMSSGDVEDAVMGVLRTESGLLASYSCSFAAPYGGVGLELSGSIGSLFVRRGPRHTVELRGPAGTEELPVAAAEPIGHATVRAFEAAVSGEGEPTATGEDGLRSLAVALATLESARDRRTVVLDALTDMA
jgi:1,5-anhydro-D-fructose reductase (1,5-anhydro-D-mannitol-forming)